MLPVPTTTERAIRRSGTKDSIASIISVDLQAVNSIVAEETDKLRYWYKWLLENVPQAFLYEELSKEAFSSIVHNLVHFEPSTDEECSHITLPSQAIVLSLDFPDADEAVLEPYGTRGIVAYRAHTTKSAFPGRDRPLRITCIEFSSVNMPEDKSDVLSRESSTEALSDTESDYKADDWDLSKIKKLAADVAQRLSAENIPQTDIEMALSEFTPRFVAAMSLERLAIAISLYTKAKVTDFCQYQLLVNDNWRNTPGLASLQVLVAWRSTTKVRFMHRVFRLVRRHNLRVEKVNLTYVNPYDVEQSVVVMSLGLHGAKGEAATDILNIDDFVRELVTLKSFRFFDQISENLVDVQSSTNSVNGNMANLLRAMVNFIHQFLLDLDPNIYTFASVREAIVRHPEIICKICKAFECKFHPTQRNLQQYESLCGEVTRQLEALDTGYPANDRRRKNVLQMALVFVQYSLKTNFYVRDKLALSFRLDPKYLDSVPGGRKEKYPELPFGVFYVKGLHFFGFHVRFRDLARGGLRTVRPSGQERTEMERQNIFTEIYNLAYTQHKKNKDIPESGSKCILFLAQNDEIVDEIAAIKREFQMAKIDGTSIIDEYKKKWLNQYLYSTQRAFITSFMDLLNWDESEAKLVKSKSGEVIDYYGKPEYIYLGPDENMHNVMIEWISEYSKKVGYKPAGSFITGRFTQGFNHKAIGVTSWGVYNYVRRVLNFFGIEEGKPFTVKITGGPDGDVGGNFILNLHRHERDTAKLLVVTDGSGTIYDPQGLDLDTLAQMFPRVAPIAQYPPEKLHVGGFLLDLANTRQQASYQRETCLFRMTTDGLKQDWISGSEANRIFRRNAHEVATDIFVPCGGRPRTLNDDNWREFCVDGTKPTSKAIVEGANLYLTEGARRQLENLGVLIVKDSSANKAGVITSSYEVLCGLAQSEAEFLLEKENLISDVLEMLQQFCVHEADLLLSHHKATGQPLTQISNQISAQIIKYTDAFLEYFASIDFSAQKFSDGAFTTDQLMQVYLDHCPKTLRDRYRDHLLLNVPETHKKAIISSTLASRLVYTNGINWEPSVVGLLPVILKKQVAAPSR